MRTVFYISLFFLVGLVALFGCRKTMDPKARQAPDTEIFLDTIQLDGKNRLSTNVEMHWFGSTPNGYIKGYEISIDKGPWIFTTSTDTVFKFTITDTTGGQVIYLQARAIDDQGTVDPTPATLKIPIRNTIPTISLENTITDTVNSVFTIRWTAKDADGDETLDSVFVKVNNGKWYPVSAKTGLFTIVPVTPGAAGLSNGKVYLEATAKLQVPLINGLLIDGLNKVYVKVKDNSRAFSLADSSIQFLINRKKGDLLVVGSHSGGPALRVCTFVTPTCQPDSRTPYQVFTAALDTVLGAGTYDFIDVVKNNNKYAPLFWDPTFYLTMKLYGKVFWYSDANALKSTCRLSLESGSAIIQKYLNDGGKILISTSIPLTNYSTPCNANELRFTLNSTMLQYSPVDSMYLSTGATLRRDSTLKPTDAAIGYPKLYILPSTGNIYTNLAPFKVKTGAEAIYTATVLKSGAWVNYPFAYSTMVARVKVNGKTNQIFSSVELNRLMSRPKFLTDFFRKVMNDEFNW